MIIIVIIIINGNIRKIQLTNIAILPPPLRAMHEKHSKETIFPGCIVFLMFPDVHTGERAVFRSTRLLAGQNVTAGLCESPFLGHSVAPGVRSAKAF